MEPTRAESLLAGQGAVLELIARDELLAVTLQGIADLIEDHVRDAEATIVVRDRPDAPPGSVVTPRIRPEEPPGVAGRPGWSQPIKDARTSAVLGVVLLGLGQRPFPTADEQRVAELAAKLAAIAILRARSAQQLAFHSRHDPLTGLVNRSVFLERAERALSSAQSTGEAIAVLFVGLDRFKDVNDTLGHRVGDCVLTALARRLEAAVRGGDTAARLGGDEFVLLCRVDGLQHARLLADRLLARVRVPFTVDDQELALTASIGISSSSEGRVISTTADELLRDAELAMHRAKDRGRARAEVYDDALLTRLLTRTTTERALRHALERQEFEIAYQPVFSLDDGEPAAVEALTRWRRPGHGLLLPGEFIGSAEDLGLIVPLGERVLSEACRQFAAWRESFADARRLTLSVNVSHAQLVHPSFVETVRSTFTETGVPPGMLCLEINERRLVADMAGTLLALDALHDLGVVLWLDFGPTHSSLEHLKQFPIDGLKLDRSFITGLAHGPTDDAIVGAVVTMAHALGMCVVGEGVENQEQRDRLTRLACDYAQGFLFARPVPADAFADQVLAARATA